MEEVSSFFFRGGVAIRLLGAHGVAIQPSLSDFGELMAPQKDQEMSNPTSLIGMYHLAQLGGPQKDQEDVQSNLPYWNLSSFVRGSEEELSTFFSRDGVAIRLLGAHGACNPSFLIGFWGARGTSEGPGDV